MTNKTILTIAVITISLTVFCAPHYGRSCPRPCSPIHCQPIHQPCPPPHHHHNDYIVGASIIGGAILGSTLINAYTQPKTIVVQQPAVQTPVVVQQSNVVQYVPTITVQKVKVWVPGRFIDQVQANGTVVRIWQEGHYEYQ